MPGFKKHLWLPAALLLLILVTAAIDKLFVKGEITIPASSSDISKDVISGNKIFSYKFHPFEKFPDKIPAFPSEDRWIFSHPMGLGNYTRIVSIEIPNPEDYSRVQYQTVFDFSDGYNPSVFWEDMNLVEGRFTFGKKRICPFLQIRLKTRGGAHETPSWIIVRVESGSPLGSPGIAGIDAFRALEDGKKIKNNESPALAEHYSERSVRVVRIESTFETYRSVNIMNGLGYSVIGEISLENFDLRNSMEKVTLYCDVVKIWKLTGTAGLTRDSLEPIVLSIYDTSRSSVILWENNGLLSEDALKSAGKDQSPVKLDRGTLWTGVILFSLLFLVAGTVKIFKLGIRFDFKKSVKYSKFIPLLAVIFLLPLIDEGINFTFGLHLLKIILFGAVSVFLIEFVRSFFISSSELILNLDAKKNKKRTITKKHYYIILASALLTSFLFAGFPGFSGAGSLLLVISNFIAGLILGYLYLKEYSLMLNALLHLLSLLPFIVLIGK